MREWDGTRDCVGFRGTATVSGPMTFDGARAPSGGGFTRSAQADKLTTADGYRSGAGRPGERQHGAHPLAHRHPLHADLLRERVDDLQAVPADALRVAREDAGQG